MRRKTRETKTFTNYFELLEYINNLQEAFKKIQETQTNATITIDLLCGVIWQVSIIY